MKVDRNDNGLWDEYILMAVGFICGLVAGIILGLTVAAA